VNRRNAITILGGAAAWPFAVSAQQTGKRPTIGFLGATTPSTAGQWVAAFVQRLGELGWTESRNLAIEYRWAEGRSERFAEIAAEFVRLKVDVIVTAGPPVFAAKQATLVIPIVFATVADPLESRLVASLARPGGQRHRPVTHVARDCGQALRTSLASADWRSWPMPPIHRLRGSWTGSRPRRARAASRSSH
jgi:putative tryptophan/tyrosine transport system substrate-binding protein